MSVVNLYSLESKFNEKKQEYISLMDSIQYSCLGKEKTSNTCVKAAKLNADMQSILIQLSNLANKTPQQPKSRTSIHQQQIELLQLSDKLERDLEFLMTDSALKEDNQVLADQNKLHALSWSFMAVLIAGLVIYQYKKI
jgi:hypothetical protein